MSIPFKFKVADQEFEVSRDGTHNSVNSYRIHNTDTNDGFWIGLVKRVDEPMTELKQRLVVTATKRILRSTRVTTTRQEIPLSVLKKHVGDSLQVLKYLNGVSVTACEDKDFPQLHRVNRKMAEHIDTLIHLTKGDTQ